MKIIWLTNMVPGAVRQSLSGSTGDGMWVDHVLSDLRAQSDLRLRILCPAERAAEGQLDADTDYQTFTEGLPYHYLPEVEDLFARILPDFSPDVIHIWGTEYGHTLAMVKAAQRCRMAEKVVVSIQGLCGPISGHYTEGIPDAVCRRSTFRDFLRRDNLLQQKRKFAMRGALEAEALSGVSHIMGRTEWDRALTAQLAPNAQYHFCNETLREPFYRDQWQYSACRKHSIFASSWAHPLKGMHYLLEALAIVRKTYPDASVSVTGGSFFSGSFSEKLREDSYSRYLAGLCEQKGLREQVTFLGSLNAEQMKAAFLEANAFVLPSSIENSPNSLGEAMLLGVPCVAADVGGVADMLHTGEGFVYQSTAPYMLAHYIMKVFAMEDRAEQMGSAARLHALQTHDPRTNLESLLAVYRQIASK